jgi:hypothetical protein
MATEQQHANGALSFDEFYQMVAICNRYHNTTMAEYNAFAAKADVDSLLAKRPASYTLEQIMSAGETVAAHLPNSRDRADFRMHLRDVYARLQPMPKLKTPEERVTVELGTTTYDLRSGGMTWEPAATPATGVEQVHAPKTIVPEPDQRRIETERFP